MSAVPAAAAPKPKDRKKKYKRVAFIFGAHPFMAPSCPCALWIISVIYLFTFNIVITVKVIIVSISLYSTMDFWVSSVLFCSCLCVFSVAASVYPYTWRRLNQPWKQSDAITAPWNRHMEILLWPDESCVHKYANIWMRHWENQSCSSS